MGPSPIPSPRFTQRVSRAGFRRAAALYDKRLPPLSFESVHRTPTPTPTCARAGVRGGRSILWRARAY